MSIKQLNSQEKPITNHGNLNCCPQSSGNTAEGRVVGLWEPEIKRTSVSGVFWTPWAFVLMNSRRLWDLCKPWKMSSQSAL